ncbi:malonyl-CoA O-methyltransferase [Volucribacter psittacicida]|uniref:Malonyl-[acyl-carrier protein] O-methyltransferase n=1 Tax=Volucribacter psittacicida TaxID=203482 RepID=A0A4R1FX74_9PAST|nr:malonyl-ACP O-methyltransferase BioC [Volucribacter psittacicida]TCJ98344.1 malonyl-CoA O-methyltransferase [Volucribacter psittacicida]
MSITKQRIAQQFTQASQSYDKQAKVQQQLYQPLLDLLRPYQQHFSHILEIGCGSGGFSAYLRQQLTADQWTFNDLCPQNLPLLQQKIEKTDRTFFCFGDAENIAFPHHYQLITAASSLQWFNDIPQFLQRCAALLDPQGYLLFNVFTPQNLTEIRQLTGIGLNYPSLNQWHQWLSKQFDLIAEQQLQIPLYFDHPIAVLKHLKQTGVNATSTGKGWSKQKYQNFIQQYQQQFSHLQGQVRLTYTPLLFLARKKSNQ